MIGAPPRPTPATGFRHGSGTLLIETLRGQVVISRADFGRVLTMMTENVAMEDLEALNRIMYRRIDAARERSRARVHRGGGEP